ncbi:hypothetical protein CC86DRAFT_404562 [Ophiobolus disseminans]|uniref:C3H1-type domain-containing protein n=1 Tax=Ophiobolus disseminans TaxID=1469910 RepID=A0A6A7A5T7_9PLEO|nr:hypothetical protein CC86DRAFT_404562 [Ophiobolus disseminans]
METSLKQATLGATNDADLDALLRPLELALDDSDRIIFQQRPPITYKWAPDYTRKFFIFLRKGFCKESDNCEHSHDWEAKQRRFCRALAAGNCIYTGRECPYSHDTNKRKLFCKFLEKCKCDLGKDCASSHDAKASRQGHRHISGKNNGIGKMTHSSTAVAVKQLLSVPSFAAYVQKVREARMDQTRKGDSASPTIPATSVASSTRRVAPRLMVPSGPRNSATPNPILQKRIAYAHAKISQGVGLTDNDRIALEAQDALYKAQAKRESERADRG